MTKKHFFILKNIDPTGIDAKYSFYVPDVVSPLLNEEETSPAKGLNRTKITDLSNKMKEHNTFSYLDESKKEHVCVLTMIDTIEQSQLPTNTEICCYWCRHPFSTRPIGCPIQFIPNRIVKNYHSEITKDGYTLRENVSENQLSENASFYEKSKIATQTRTFYVTDGVFCSFNCCLSFIHDEHTTPLYSNSEHLLMQIYTDLFGSSARPILPAPSWRLLRSYGGIMTIDEFRKSFYKIDYKDTNNVVLPVIRSKPVGFLFERQVRI